MVKPTTDAIVAGLLCLDISPDFDGLSKPVRLSEVFAPTRLTSIGQATLSTGGAVSNTGVVLHRLGLKVGLMGKIGQDTFGRAVREILAREAPGYGDYNRVAQKEPTSYTIVVSPPGIDRFFLHCAGANNSFGFDDLDLAAIKRARLFHFGYPTIMKRVLAQNGRELVKIYRSVHALGVTTSLDLTMPDANSAQGRFDWQELLPRLLPHVDVFVPSVEELIFIMAPTKFKKLLRKSKGGDLLDALEIGQVMQLAKQCLQMGVKVMLVKCGRLGIYARTGSAEEIEQMGKACPTKRIKDWADREIFEPSFQVKRIASALGAGDCAVAGFLAGLLRGLGLADALRYSTGLGAQNVRVVDAISGIKSWAHTKRQLAKKPAKNLLSMNMDGWTKIRSQGHYLGPNDHI